ncbi:precorrin-2 dehydrogenase/sirohydrochlorin ferrochelatase family protein [Shewanella sedimentimangrovi]|uniref:precorrin-2 dehydrogenase n=1 Tax=Shewanella sedimentimangrovi TaxID=2814293 RepID=A0ABX7QWU4_9GAMM|nr:bifunctional precorrin-2 dehydrogenase/sirohydrochlorin ferrochelatase [Shewanella sedimentimangrovi]QSX35973.1 bifunctional precorrin-2 dehydrogenase/sirohydrochlorin ferrochelatase [Shewanella sedimentimangrovi]
MQYFPLFVDTHNLKVLLVGAGDVAARKLALLNRTQAQITVIAPEVCDEVQALAASGHVQLLQRPICDADISDWDLLYLATADNELNRHYANLARHKGIWVNVVDSPAECRFITPSIVDRGRLVVAISTAGAAPVFARDIRARLETWLPPSLAPLFDFIADKRPQVQQRLASVPQRRRFWERFFALNGDRFDDSTMDHFEQAFGCENWGGEGRDGELWLIDDATRADLLPIAALAPLQRIDCICSDISLPLELSELLRRDADRKALPASSELSHALEAGQRLLVYGDADAIDRLKAQFPMARHLRPGAL